MFNPPIHPDLENRPRLPPNFNFLRLQLASRLGFLMATLILGSFFLNDLIEDRWSDEPDSIIFSTHALALAISAVAGCITWKSRRLSFFMIERLEKICILSIIVFNCAYQYSELRRFRQHILGVEEHDLDIAETLSDSFCLRWCLIILIYIILIPQGKDSSQERKRLVSVHNSEYEFLLFSLLSALTIALIPVLITVLFCAGNGMTGRGMNLATEMILYLAAASALGIYTRYHFEISHRGEQIAGAWILEEKVSDSGGFADIYLARHRRTSQPVVLKFPHRLPDWMDEEANLMSQLSHPNLARIYYFDKGYGNLPYIVMERINGINLHHFFMKYYYSQDKTSAFIMEPGRVLSFLRQVASAIQAVHALKILHLDIKPGNIMIASYPGYHDFLKVIDFGISRRFESGNGTLSGKAYGTPGFMSPEQSRGEAVDIRSDIYSIGAFGYFLLTGEHAAHRPPEERLTRKMPALESRSCPGDLHDFLATCLESDRERRFDDIPSFLKALNNLSQADSWTETLAAAWWASRLALESKDETLIHAGTTRNVT